MATDPPGLMLRVERSVDAGRDRVFRALIAPEDLRLWWGPRGFSAQILELDPRMGGRYRIAMTPPDEETFHVTGAFLDIAPPDRLEYTFRWEEPDPDDRETVVAVSLDQRDATTLLTVAQGFFATEARCELHRRGWSDSLDRLGEVLSTAG
jgi:uncharacterized protein YndB with AHSA1/START domain